LQGTVRDTLFHAVRAAMRGEMLLQPGIMDHVLAHATRLTYPVPAGKDGDELTDRERAALESVAKGLRSKEIAIQLGTTENTVK
jgi:NarL family two-component system response regulator YdfI